MLDPWESESITIIRESPPSSNRCCCSPVDHVAAGDIEIVSEPDDDGLWRPGLVQLAAEGVDPMIAWTDSASALEPRGIYRLKHTTRTVRAMATDVLYRLDVSTMHRDLEANSLALNEVGRATLRTMAPIFADDYRRNRRTGSFILIDEATNQTVAGGMIRTQTG